MPTALRKGQPDLRSSGSFIAARLPGRAISKYFWWNSFMTATGSSSADDSELSRSVTCLMNLMDLSPLFRGERRPDEEDEEDEDNAEEPFLAGADPPPLLSLGLAAFAFAVLGLVQTLFERLAMRRSG
ncbi:hypothetical protein MRX96_029534 [Rhipicephalus microplus]